MFLIFGLRTKAHRLGLVPMACRVCGQSGSMLLVREVTKFSLFFVPLIPVRTKHVLYCTNPLCGAHSTISAGEARQLLAAGTGSPR
ncbi:zinc-ribbon domain-containing protein [Plantactinospora sp. CA-290183]|uniref:zinc-ribbon domain-containing protein n=1 Tax=Plantactinospora sp. CA-290183 TaxID=3240006 RepID=UPI003D91E607